MKKRALISVLILLLIMTGILTGCAPKAEELLTAPVKIGSLNGPTGIGMVKLLEAPDKYQVTLYQSPDEVVGKIVSGEVDVAAVPSNLAAVLYNKLEGDIVLIGVNTLGVLYIVENGEAVTDISALKGKTIVASGKGGTPEFILNQLLVNAGLDPQKDLTIFLKDYAASVDFVNSDAKASASLVSEYGIISDVLIAEKAIPQCNIVFISAQDGKADLVSFYEIISAMDPKSIGGTMPDENFYFKGIK